MSADPSEENHELIKSDGFIGIFMVSVPLLAQVWFFLYHHGHGDIVGTLGMAIPIYVVLGGLHILYFFRAPMPRKLEKMSSLYVIWRNVSLTGLHGMAVLQMVFDNLEWLAWVALFSAAICSWLPFKIWKRDIVPKSSA